MFFLNYGTNFRLSSHLKSSSLIRGTCNTFCQTTFSEQTFGGEQKPNFLIYFGVISKSLVSAIDSLIRLSSSKLTHSNCESMLLYHHNFPADIH